MCPGKRPCAEAERHDAFLAPRPPGGSRLASASEAPKCDHANLVRGVPEASHHQYIISSREYKPYLVRENF